MKLSEAMRKGFAKAGPCFSRLYMELPDGTPLACAAGSAFLGAGGDPKKHQHFIYRALCEMFPELRRPSPFKVSAQLQPADEGDDSTNLYAWIVWMFDTERLTREAIANALESVGL